MAYIADNSTKHITDAFEQILINKGVTRVQWIALYYLQIQKHINQKELADRMNIKESTVARLVDRMERDELVVRQRSEEDRRVYNLVLTEKGQKYIRELIPVGEKFSEMISLNITEEEMETFMNVLEKMMNNLQNYMINEK